MGSCLVDGKKNVFLNRRIRPLRYEFTNEIKLYVPSVFQVWGIFLPHYEMRVSQDQVSENGLASKRLSSLSLS